MRAFRTSTLSLLLALILCLGPLAPAALAAEENSGAVPTGSVTFDANGGHYDDDSAKEAIPLISGGFTLRSPKTPVRAGYAFLGWFLGGQKISEVKYHPFQDGDVLTAGWELSRPTYEITLDPNGGVCGAEILPMENGRITSLPVPTREGYIFRGWFRSWSQSPITTDEVFTGPDTLKARWTQVPAAKPAFTDVAADSPFAGAVRWATERGIANGTTPTTFSPGGTCTRGQTVTFLWRSQGSPEPSIENPFQNSVPDAFQKAAIWAYEKGVITLTTFNAAKPCTRADLATYLWRLAGKPEAGETAPFTDVKAASSYAGAVSWAAEQGVTNGTGGGVFSPDAICTRGQIVTFLYRAYGK